MNQLASLPQWLHLRRIAGAALAAGLLLPLQGALIDDYSDPPRWDQWYVGGLAAASGVGWSVADGRLWIKGEGVLPAFDPNNLTKDYASAAYNQSTPDMPVREGQTLELRLRSFASNHDNLFGLLLYGDRTLPSGGNGYYFVAVDRNEVALFKRTNVLFFWDSIPETTDPMDIILALTRRGEEVEIAVRLHPAGDPSTLIYERRVIDGPGSDAQISGPVGPGVISRPEPATGDRSEPYGEIGYWVESGLIGLSTEPLAGPEVSFGGFDYVNYPAVAEMAIQQAVKIDFVHTPEPQIILGAPRLGGPWTPCLESLHRAGDRWEMAVPVTENQGFFTVARGFTAEEDFETGLGAAWSVLPAPGMEDRFTAEIIEAGTYRNHQLCLTSDLGSATEDGSLTLLRDDPETMDFAVAVDVPAFTMLPETEVGLIARAAEEEGLNGYVAGVALGKPEGACLPGKLWIRKIVDGVSVPLAERCPEKVFLTPGTDFRLQFTGVENQLTLELIPLNRPDLVVEPLSVEDATFTQGSTGLWLSLPTARATVTVDNFRAVGTLPE